MILPLAHWELLPTMPWPAAHTSRLSLSNGANITVFLTLFPKEAHLKLENFAVMFYLNKSTPTPPLNVHTPLSPTNNRSFENAGVVPHFAILKEIQL